MVMLSDMLLRDYGQQTRRESGANIVPRAEIKDVLSYLSPIIKDRRWPAVNHWVFSTR